MDEKKIQPAGFEPDDPRYSTAFPGLLIAGEHDDAPTGPMQATMNEDWGTYLGARATVEFNRLHPYNVSHAQLLPDASVNQIIIVPCDEHAYGAQEIKYSETEKSMWVNMRQAMQRLRVERLPGRVRIFNMTVRNGTDGKEYLAVIVKPSKSRPVKKVEKTNAQKPEEKDKEKSSDAGKSA